MPGNLLFNLYLDEDDLPPMPSLEEYEEVNLEREETIAERMKLNPWKGKTREAGLKFWHKTNY